MGNDCVCDALGAAYVKDADGLTELGAADPDADDLGVPEDRADAEVADGALADDDALALAGPDTDALALPDTDAGEDGENIAGWVGDVDEGRGFVQAATATATQTVTAAAPTAVVAVLTAAPASAARTFMKPPTEWIILLTKRLPPVPVGASYPAATAIKLSSRTVSPARNGMFSI